MANTLTFGERLRQLRQAAGLSLAPLAKGISVSIVHLSDIERNKKNPPAPTKILKLVQMLGVPNSFQELLVLAARSRRTVEISMEGKSDEFADVMVALARRSDDNDIDDDLLQQIKQLLESRND